MSKFIFSLLVACATGASAQSVSTYLGTTRQSGGPIAGTGSAARLQVPSLMLPDGPNQILLYDSSARTIYTVSLGTTYGTLNPLPVAANVTISAWALASNGDILVADATAHVIRRFNRSGGATVIAGVSGLAGTTDGAATTLGRLNQPTGVTQLANGDIYIADTGNHTIRQLTAGQLSTIIGFPGMSGTADGTLGLTGVAKLTSPRHLVANLAGDIFWVDANTRVRNLATGATTTSTVASNLVTTVISVVGNNTLLFADSGAHLAYQLPIGGTPSIIAGVPNAPGFANGSTGAKLTSPTMVLPGPLGSFIISDTGNNALRRVGASLGAGPTFILPFTNATVEVGNPVTLSAGAASTGTTLYEWRKNNTVVQFSTTNNLLATSDAILSDTAFYSLTVYDDLGSVASGNVALTVTADDPLFNFSTVVDSSRIPSAVNSFVLSPDGWLYFAEPQRHVVSRINTTNGLFETLAGFPALSGVLDGVRTTARFNSPHSVALDAGGNIYVTDAGNHTLRKITPGGQVTTLSGAAQVSGFTDGPPVNSRYSGPSYLINDPSGLLLVLDGSLGNFAYSRIRTVDGNGNSATTYALDNGSYTPSLPSRPGTIGGGIRAFATNVSFGIRFIAHNFPLATEVRELGNVGVIAGNISGNIDGTGAKSLFGHLRTFNNPNITDGPRSMVHDSFSGANNFIIVDTVNHSLRRLRSTNVVTTLAGGAQGYRDGLTPLFDTPAWAQLDPAGNLWTLDGGGRRIRKGTRIARLQILIPPYPQDIGLGGSGTLSVSAVGAAALSYQWRKDGQNIPGATSSTFTINNAALTDAGSYSVVVANSFATVATFPVAVQVLRAPSLQLQPQTVILQEIVPGIYGAASFIVLASGDGQLTYQWFKDGGGIAGANQPQYTILTPVASDQGVYSIRVQNSVGAATSSGALLTLLIPPVITAPPTSQTNFAGSNAIFSVVVTGTPPLSFQWLKNGAPLPSGSLNPLTLNNLSVPDSGLYSVVVSNAAGVAVSSAAALVVRSAPVILSQPGARISGAAQSVTFSVIVGGDAPLVYQWRKNGTDIPGATGANYSIGAVAPAHEGLYSVGVTNALGSTASSAARLTVLPVSVSVPWAASGGGSGSDVGKAIAVDLAGNSYVAGYFSGTATFGTNTLISAGRTDIFITKQDSAGQLLWARRAGGPGYDSANGIAVDTLGNCFVTGGYEGVADFSGSTSLTNTSPTSYGDAFLVKYDASGNLVWARSAGVAQAADEGAAVAVDGGGNVLVTGRSALASFAGVPVANAGRIFVAKYDSAGAELWARKVGSYSGGSLDTGTGIAADGTGNVLVSGVFTSPVAGFGGSTFTNLGNADMFLLKFDPSGALLWARQAGGAGEDAASGVAVASDGSAYLVGATGGAATFSGSNVTSLAGAASDGFIAKYAADGSVVWVRQMGGSGISAARAVAVDQAGTLHVAGYFSGGATFGTNTFGGIAGSYDAFVTRLDANGVFAFAQQAGGADLSGDFGLGVGVDAAGNSYIAGYFSGTSSIGGGLLPSRGAEDVLVARFNQFTGGGTPQLGLQRNGAQFRMRWPLASSSYILQSTTNLLAPVWRDETNALTLNGSDLEIDVTPSSGGRFFRLRRP